MESVDKVRWGGPLILAAVVIAAGFLAGAARADGTARLVRQGTPHEALFGIAFDGSRGLAVGALGAVLETSNAGRSWQKVEGPSTNLALLGVAIRGNKGIAVGQLGSTFVTDGGPWRAAQSEAEERLFSVGLVSDRVAVAVGAFGTIVRSLDGGETWQRQEIDWVSVLEEDFEPHLYDVTMTDEGAVVIVGEFGLVLRSEDAGASWRKVRKGEESLFGVAFAGHYGLAVGQDGAVVSTADAGRSWQAVKSGLDANLLDVWLHNDKAVVVGVRSAAISEDGGRSWQRLAEEGLDEGWHQAVSAADDLPVAVGYAGRMLTIE